MLPPLPSLKLVSKRVDSLFNYAVLSRLYPEDPSMLVVTLRGNATWTNTAAYTGGGVTILDVGTGKAHVHSTLRV